MMSKEMLTNPREDNYCLPTATSYENRDWSTMESLSLTQQTANDDDVAES